MQISKIKKRSSWWISNSFSTNMNCQKRSRSVCEEKGEECSLSFFSWIWENETKNRLDKSKKMTTKTTKWRKLHDRIHFCVSFPIRDLLIIIQWYFRKFEGLFHTKNIFYQKTFEYSFFRFYSVIFRENPYSFPLKWITHFQIVFVFEEKWFSHTIFVFFNCQLFHKRKKEINSGVNFG